jgi:hypothetical protein
MLVETFSRFWNIETSVAVRLTEVNEKTQAAQNGESGNGAEEQPKQNDNGSPPSLNVGTNELFSTWVHE